MLPLLVERLGNIWNAIISFPVCDVLNFEISLNFSRLHVLNMLISIVLCRNDLLFKKIKFKTFSYLLESKSKNLFKAASWLPILEIGVRISSKNHVKWYICRPLQEISRTTFYNFSANFSIICIYQFYGDIYLGKISFGARKKWPNNKAFVLQVPALLTLIFEEFELHGPSWDIVFREILLYTNTHRNNKKINKSPNKKMDI